MFPLSSSATYDNCGLWTIFIYLISINSHRTKNKGKKLTMLIRDRNNISFDSSQADIINCNAAYSLNLAVLRI